MKPRSILAPFIMFQAICCWLSLATAVAQPLASRSATASAYIERGNARFAKGEYERALADYDLAIASDPSNAGGYYNRAITRCRLNDYERALADFNRAIQLNPRFIRAAHRRGETADGGSQSNATASMRLWRRVSVRLLAYYLSQSCLLRFNKYKQLSSIKT